MASGEPEQKAAKECLGLARPLNFVAGSVTAHDMEDAPKKPGLLHWLMARVGQSKNEGPVELVAFRRPPVLLPAPPFGSFLREDAQRLDIAIVLRKVELVFLRFRDWLNLVKVNSQVGSFLRKIEMLSGGP